MECRRIHKAGFARNSTSFVASFIASFVGLKVRDRKPPESTKLAIKLATLPRHKSFTGRQLREVDTVSAERTGVLRANVVALCCLSQWHHVQQFDPVIRWQIQIHEFRRALTDSHAAPTKGAHVVV